MHLHAVQPGHRHVWQEDANCAQHGFLWWVRLKGQAFDAVYFAPA